MSSPENIYTLLNKLESGRASPEDMKCAAQRIRKLTAQNSSLENRSLHLNEVFQAAHGLCFGTDWNKGAHAIQHGFREKLKRSVARIDRKHPVARDMSDIP